MLQGRAGVKAVAELWRTFGFVFWEGTCFWTFMVVVGTHFSFFCSLWFSGKSLPTSTELQAKAKRTTTILAGFLERDSPFVWACSDRDRRPWICLKWFRDVFLVRLTTVTRECASVFEAFKGWFNGKPTGQPCWVVGGG